MSKFVTYPAVTVLDDDQSLLIASPSAGTNSITAENAGNTLLSKWAGFDTFDEAVQNTISNNQEFIDRDTAIREETAELKKKIVTTFPAKEASGAVATFESEFEDAPLKSCIVQVQPVQDLHGYDHPWPAGGGKNLFNEEYTSSWLTYVPVFVGDGTYTLSTSMPRARDGTTNLFLLAGNVSSGASSAGNGASEGHPRTVESVDGYVTVAYRNALGVDPASYETQLESGSTATSYVPYENICPISGWEEVKVEHAGKNLFDFTEFARQYPNNCVYDQSTGELQVSTFSSLYNTGVAFDFNLNDGGYVSAEVKCETAINVRIGVWYSDGTFTETSGASDTSTFVRVYTTLRKKRITSIRLNWTTAGTFTLRNFYLTSVATATDYEPYQGTSISIQLGQTVYGGKLDVLNGELVVDRAMVDLWTLNWSNARIGSSAPTGHHAFMSTGFGAKYAGSDEKASNLICSQYVAVSRNNTYRGDSEGFAINAHGNLYAYIAKYATGTASDFKTAMSGVQLVYELATPIHYPLTPTEIKTLLGQNNIWSNTGDISVGYLMSDVGWYVEKKLRAFQSILAGVEDSEVASKNYSTDSYLIFNDDIYRVTKTITAGETIEDGVNVTKTTVAEQLMALAQV